MCLICFLHRADVQLDFISPSLLLKKLQREAGHALQSYEMQTEAWRNSCFPNIVNSLGKFVLEEAINASATTDTLIITAKQKNICMQGGLKTTLQLVQRKMIKITHYDGEWNKNVPFCSSLAYYSRISCWIMFLLLDSLCFFWLK